MAEDRNQAPSARKREEARRAGRVARSSDLVGAVVLLGGLLLLRATGGEAVGALSALLVDGLSAGALPDDAAGVLDAGRAAAGIGRVAWASAPFALGLVAVALAINLLQVGILWSAEAVAPDASRLDPGAGLARIFSARSAVRGLASLLKVNLLVAVLVLTLSGEFGRLPALGSLPARDVGAAWAALAFSAGITGAGALLALGLLDYLYQWWEHERALRMTPQEAIEEIKLLEGDPQVKEQRRRARRSVAVQGLVAAVDGALAVLRAAHGPAIALRHDAASGLLRVAAKGDGLLAERLTARAREHGVPVIEADPLVRALYRAVEAGDDVPAAHYRAVAALVAPGIAVRRRAAGAHGLAQGATASLVPSGNRTE
ncbi:MAG: EscU/YscU/HrcU family type III secretion system export apparatus switch protein [Planctomycetes bacterium]|nr:EscU/YscU/HrcU family type III secretion system export apparatus switch protein [Planctomycetota bacterium]